MVPDIAHAASVQSAESIQAGQSSVKDWQDALAASGYHIVGPTYASSTAASQSAVKEPAYPRK